MRFNTTTSAIDLLLLLTKKIRNFTIVWSNFENSFISWLLKNTPSYNGLKVAQKVQFACSLVIETIVGYFEGNRANPQTMNWPKNITYVLSKKICQIRFDDLFIHLESKPFFFQISLFFPFLCWVDHGTVSLNYKYIYVVCLMQLDWAGCSSQAGVRLVLAGWSAVLPAWLSKKVAETSLKPLKTSKAC